MGGVGMAEPIMAVGDGMVIVQALRLSPPMGSRPALDHRAPAPILDLRLCPSSRPGIMPTMAVHPSNGYAGSSERRRLPPRLSGPEHVPVRAPLQALPPPGDVVVVGAPHNANLRRHRGISLMDSPKLIAGAHRLSTQSFRQA